jgi:1,4-alpha-glucan branching enzyme
MTVEDQSKIDLKSLKKKRKSSSTTSKRRSSKKASSGSPTPTRPSGNATQSSATTATPNITTTPQVNSHKDRRTTATAAADSDKQTIHPGIDALTVMKRAEDEKRAVKPDKLKSTEHVSAIEAIAKATVRDHPIRDVAQQPREPEKAKKKAMPRPAQPIPLPVEPKEPLGGVGAEGLPLPIVDSQEVAAILNADHADPFSFLGMHSLESKDTLIVRAFLPDASEVKMLDSASGEVVAQLEKVHDEGLFVGEISGRKQPFAYRYRITIPEGEKDIDDPYRFPPVLSNEDTRALAKGEHFSSYLMLGSHPAEIEGAKGVTFAVWAPNASNVSVVGDFNGWDGRRHTMRRRHECGVWEIFLPGVSAGSLYKYEIKSAPGTTPKIKSDPYAFYAERPPGLASVVHDIKQFRWGDSVWMNQRKKRHKPDAPISFYEVHLGSWRRKPEEDNRWLTYRELANELVEYVSDVGFTHISLLPVSEHTFEDTVGYLPSALYAPTNRYGTPDDFRYLVDICHRSGIGVVVDWVPNFLSTEPHGLALFDDTTLYENPDPLHGSDPDWKMPLYNFGSPAVVNYLLANALYWLDQFHLDGLRIDSLAKMLYLDYGRGEGEWVPNKYGGNDSLETLEFIRRLNELVSKNFPGAMTIAEDSSLRKELTRSAKDGGLGFSLRWNSAWAYDTLLYLGRRPVHRKYYHYELVNPLNFAFDEKFILPVSHDHVSIGQGALINKLPGDRWQKFATLRAWLGLMYALPGKKLMFMGIEFAQDREWNSNISLDWHLLQDPMHCGVQQLIRDFNKLYREVPSLHEMDADSNGFEWLDVNDGDNSVVSFVRYSKDRKGVVVAVTHFTPVVRPNYRIGVPELGYYKEVLNTDAEIYGGGNWGSEGGAMAEHHWAHGREFSMCLTLPPYATVVLEIMRE